MRRLESAVLVFLYVGSDVDPGDEPAARSPQGLFPSAGLGACRMTAFALVLLAFLALAMVPVRVAAGPIPSEVLKRLIDGAKESQAKYDQVHIVAEAEQTGAGKTYKFPFDFYQDGDAVKITRQLGHLATDTGDKVEIVTYVASPKLTFCIRKPLGAKQFTLNSIDRNGADYEWMRHAADNLSVPLQFPCNWSEMPVARFLAMKELSITAFRQEEQVGAKLCRLDIHVSAQSLVAASRRFSHPAYDHLDGWLLMEIEPHVVVRGFNFKYRTSSKELLGDLKCSLDYTEQEKSIPRLEKVHFEAVDGKGKNGLSYRVKVNSLEFGPVAPEQFTLHGSGFGK